MPVSTISKDTLPMIDVPFRITGKYKGSFEESLRREYRMAFGRGMMGGEIFYPGTTRIVHIRGEFTNMKFGADGASFQIEGVYVSDVAPYGLDLGVLLAATLEQKMKFFAKSLSKDAVYQGAPKGTKVIVGTPKVTAESVPIAPIGTPSRRARPNPCSCSMRRANPSKPKPRTYAVARAEILRALQQDGWDVRANLKMPHATYPRGGFRLWFKTQAIYESHGSGTSSFAGAHSLWIGDIRTMPIEDVLAHIERVRKSSVYPYQNPAKRAATRSPR